MQHARFLVSTDNSLCVQVKDDTITSLSGKLAAESARVATCVAEYDKQCEALKAVQAENFQAQVCIFHMHDCARTTPLVMYSNVSHACLCVCVCVLHLVWFGRVGGPHRTRLWR